MFNTAQAICFVGKVLQLGTPFLVYLYYAFGQWPWWFRAILRATDALGRFVSILPLLLKNMVCEVIALLAYLSLARADLFLDCFGARLEHRFCRQELDTMLQSAGFRNIRFSDTQPFCWCAVAVKS